MFKCLFCYSSRMMYFTCSFLLHAPYLDVSNSCTCMWHEVNVWHYVLYFSVQLEQGTVTSLVEEDGTVKGVKYKTKSGEELKAYAPLTIVCDGCFSNLRRALCSPKVQFLDFALSFFVHACRRSNIDGNMWLGWCTILFCWAGPGELSTSSCKPWPCCPGQSFTYPILPNKQHWSSLFGWCPWSEGAFHSKRWNGKISQNSGCTSGIILLFQSVLSRVFACLLIATKCQWKCSVDRFLQKSMIHS